MTLKTALKSGTALTLGLLAYYASEPAFAAVDELVITARRRSETLFDAPATITAIGQDTLRLGRLDDITSIIQLIPNAVVPDNPQSFSTFVNIRGIRNPDPQAEPAFGLYRNGVFFGGQRTNLGSLVDVQQVEVLRGPQGGLYGRNAVGGAINIVYATPTDELEGYGSFTYGRYQRTDLEGVINVPVSDNFAVRAAGWFFNQEEGEFFNVFLNEELDESQDVGGRISARADFSESVSLTVIGEYQSTEGPSNRSFAPNGAVQTLGLVGAPETPSTIMHDTLNDAEFEQFYVSWDLEVDTAVGTFNLLGSYRDYEYASTEDQDFGAIPATTPFSLMQIFDRDEEVSSNYIELLWTSPQDQPLTWIAGISYFDQDFDFSRTFTSFLNLDAIGFAPLGVRSASGALPGPSSIDTTSLSVFGELTYQINDQLSLIGSLRWTEDDKSLDYNQFIFSDDPVSLPIFEFLFSGSVPTFSLSPEPSFVNLSPGGGIQYEVNENINLYFTANTGFRAGGFNTTSTDPALVPYGPEKATNFEIGAKTSWMDGRVTLNAALFRMKQSDLLLFRDDPVDTMFFFTFLDNVGEATTWGAEAELTKQLTDWWTSSLSVGWLDPEISKGENQEASGAFVDLSGNQIPVTRDLTVSLRQDFQYPLPGFDWNAIGYVNARWETGGYININNTVKYESLELMDLAVGVENEWFRIIGFVDNAFDDTVTTFQFSVGAETLTRGRTFGVELSASF